MSLDLNHLRLDDFEILALRAEYERKNLGDLAKMGPMRNGLDSLHLKLYSAISQPTFDKALDKAGK
jgi:hypothetical protein